MKKSHQEDYWWSLENLVGRPNICEFSDLSWMTSAYKRYVQEALVFSYESVPWILFRPLAEHVCQFLRQHNIKSVTVLGAGAGGPIFRLQKYFLSQGTKVHFTLTDLVPNPTLMQKADELLFYEPSSVNAIDARPTYHDQAIMMIGCFHHFDERQARMLLDNFKTHQSLVYIMEVSTRNWLNLFCNLLFWLPCTLSAPLISPFSWSRILFSWVIPIFPLMFVIDGIISGVRTYSKKEFLAMWNPDLNYKWEVTDLSFFGGLFKIRSYVGRPWTRN